MNIEKIKEYQKLKKELTTGVVTLIEEIPYNLWATFCEIYGKDNLDKNYKQSPIKAAYVRMSNEEQKILQLEKRIRDLELNCSNAATPKLLQGQVSLKQYLAEQVQGVK